MQKTLNKKGISVWNLMGIGVTFVVLTVSLGIGAWINDELVTDAYGTTSVVNETVTFAANNTYYDLAYKSASITEVTNITDTLGTANYTTRDMGYITQIIGYFGETTGSGLKYNVSYNSYQSDSHFVTMNSTNALSTLASWLPIIAIVIAAGVVIASLLMAFGKRGGY